MRIQVEDIQKDMSSDEDVYSNQGNLIVGRGFSVSNAMILKNLLRQHRVDKVKVLTLSEEVAPPSPKEKIDQEIVDFKLEFHDTVSTIENEISSILGGEIEEEKLNSLVESSLSMQSGTTLNIFQMMQKVKDSDDVTYSHCYSVSLSAYAIGKWLKLSEEELKELTLSAILADAGKASVPKEILMKKRGIEVIFSQNEKDSIFTDFSQARKYLLDGFLVKVRLAELTRVFKSEDLEEFDILHKMMKGK